MSDPPQTLTSSPLSLQAATLSPLVLATLAGQFMVVSLGAVTVVLKRKIGWSFAWTSSLPALA